VAQVVRLELLQLYLVRQLEVLAAPQDLLTEEQLELVLALGETHKQLQVKPEETEIKAFIPMVKVLADPEAVVVLHQI
jgi:hypothetical protein